MKLYADNQRMISYDIDVEVCELSEEVLNEVKYKYNLSAFDLKKLKENVRNNTPTLFEKSVHTLFLPYISIYGYHDPLLIAFKTNNNLVVEEAFIILNLLKVFEVYIYNGIKNS